MKVDPIESNITDQQGEKLDYHGVVRMLCDQPSWDFQNNQPIPIQALEMFKREELKAALDDELTVAQTELLRRLAMGFPWGQNHEDIRDFLVHIGVA